MGAECLFDLTWDRCLYAITVQVQSRIRVWKTICSFPLYASKCDSSLSTTNTKNEQHCSFLHERNNFIHCNRFGIQFRDEILFPLRSYRNFESI